MLKDLARAGMGLLFFIRRQTVKHRKKSPQRLHDE
jgi:hypothetical protein